MIWCQVKIGFKDLKRYRETITRVSRDVGNKQTQPGLCCSKIKDDIDDILNHRGAEMVFLAMNSIDILEEIKILRMIMTNFVERLYEDAIEQRRHQAKGIDEAEGYWIHGYGASSKSSLWFEVK